MNNDIDACLAFCGEMEGLKTIFRRNKLRDGETFEDDTQHSWHAAVMGMAPARYALPGTDVLKAIQMLLIHDIVEIDAGDVYAYDTDAQKGKEEREQKAAERIFGILPEPESDEFRQLWEEFEQGRTKEAMFANAMDRLQPLVNHYQNGGVVWVENGISREQLYERNKYAKQSLPMLWPKIAGMIEQAHENGWLK